MIRWQTKKLGDVCDIVGGGTPKTGISKYWNGELCWVTPKDLGQLSGIELSDTYRKISQEGLENSSVQLLPIGSVILSSRAPIGYVAINTVPMTTNQGCRSFICGPDIFNKYLYYFLVLNEDYLDSMGSGSTFREISGSKLRGVEIPLPPLAEQKKIVGKIERAFAKIDEAARLRAAADTDASGLLGAALDRVFEGAKEKRWEEKEIGELAIEIKSGFACAKRNEVDDGIVHLRTHNIDLSGELNLDKIVKIPESFVDKEIFNLKKGDIIFNNTNSAELVGKTIIIRKDLPYAFSNHLTRIRFNKSKVIPEWILLIFQKLWRDKYFESLCTRWVGQAGINQSSLARIKIPLPPLTEQKMIAAELDALSEKVWKLRNLQEEVGQELKELKRAVLREMFIQSE